jgi:demethylmenaquinone methyltransferase / 2-methoxy-6-polyprenyl-1,4-benzoquinol methylase
VPSSNEHDRRIAAMFDRIAPRYDLLNRLLSLGTDLTWRRRALELARLGDDARALDVGTGTGDFALALLARAPRSATVAGVDISAGMLGIAERRAAKAGLGRRYERLIASVESLPFADGTFDVAVAGFVIRNVGDIPQGLREMRRVLRPGGRAVILDLHTPRNPAIRRLYRAYSSISPRLAAALGGDPAAYRYLPRSIEAFYDPEALARLLRNAGFTRVHFERLTFGIAAIHVGEK